LFIKSPGGEGGIRTHGGLTPTTVFEFYVVRVIWSVWSDLVLSCPGFRVIQSV